MSRKLSSYSDTKDGGGGPPAKQPKITHLFPVIPSEKPTAPALQTGVQRADEREREREREREGEREREKAAKRKDREEREEERSRPIGEAGTAALVDKATAAAKTMAQQQQPSKVCVCVSPSTHHVSVSPLLSSLSLSPLLSVCFYVLRLSPSLTMFLF
jgi:hypothetical protein